MSDDLEAGVLPEYREAVDAALIGWERQHAIVIRNNPVTLNADGSVRSGHTCTAESDMRAFAYWLIRRSGLVVPTALDR